MKSYKIGIDTGGTYTDAVVFDPEEKKVLKSVKALTSHGRLELGIVSALKELFQDKKAVYKVSDIGLVSLSTTLATNSLVEKKGTDPGVVLIGFSDDMEQRSHLKDLVSQERILRIPGGHRYDGSEKNPLNLEKLQQFLETSGKSLKNFAVASNYSVRNSEHEILAGELIEKMTRGRVSLSSSLTSDLNSPRRAYSATLNAKIQTLMEDLVEAVKRAMEELKLKAPLMMVKSDGSIDPVERALDRPIETVASGPAASVIGACSLTGLKDFVISDIGGTTTDTAVVEGGWPLVEKHHAIMQERETSIPSIRVRSYALGGDSEVNPEKEGELEILSRRVVPVSLMAHHYPEVLQNLEAASRERKGLHGAHRYLIKGKEQKKWEALLVPEEAELLEMIGDFPVPYHRFSGRARYRAMISRLYEMGVIQISGLTLSDAAHVLGLQDHWSKAAARAGLIICGRWNGMISENPQTLEEELRNYAEKIHEQSVKKSTRIILETLSTKTVLEEDPLVEAFLEEDGRLNQLEVQLKSSIPLVAVGGPANTVYPEVGRKLGTETVIPEFASVANAVGAASGSVKITASCEVTNPESKGFLIHHGNQVHSFQDPDQALADAEKLVEQTIRKKVRDMQFECGPIEVEIDKILIPGSDGNQGLVSATLRGETLVELG